jgi:hypothetical protein
VHGGINTSKRRNYTIRTQNVIIRWEKLKKRDRLEHRGFTGG